MDVTSTGPGNLTRISTAVTVSGEQTVTIDVRRTVEDVRFTLADIEWVDNNGTYGVQEVITVSPESTATAASGVTVSGSGLQTTTPNTTGSAFVTIAGPVTRITVTLGVGTVGKATRDVLIQNMTFRLDLRSAA